MDKNEVTQQKYWSVMKENPSQFKDCEQCPVENVAWEYANKYCLRLGKKLPLEREWEYAARANTVSNFYWGDSIDDAFAWYADNSNYKTHLVGQKKPNGFGLYDISGNVWEWCEDLYVPGKILERNADNMLSEKAKVGAAHVIRGGSWADQPGYLRSAYRSQLLPEGWPYRDGFRCICR
jgi:formylglycine-generating enzyme required for sulfatase activity